MSLLHISISSQHSHLLFIPEHNVIVKGCVNNREEDASMKVRELNVPLYWANKEKVKGESLNYCKN